MTKQDGDKLRAMQNEVRKMQLNYGWSTGTSVAFDRIAVAIELALRGVNFEIGLVGHVNPAIREALKQDNVI